MRKNIDIVAFSGSFRAASFNTSAIKVAADVLPKHATLELLHISALPLYNQDLGGEHTPQPVMALANRVAAADAIVFATPEYNYSVPGGLKNAIDWLSRQQPQPFAGKPAAIMSASIGFLGGARAQYHLRQIMTSLDVHCINKPEVMIASAHQKFDSQGRITDPATRDFIEQLMAALVAFQQRLNV